MRSAMSISVQTATGVVWPRRDPVSRGRTAAERDEPTAVDRTAGRRSRRTTPPTRCAWPRCGATPPLTAATETPRTHSAVDDNVIAGAPPTG